MRTLWIALQATLLAGAAAQRPALAIPESGVSLELRGFEPSNDGGDERWTGRIGRSTVTLSYAVLPRQGALYTEPEHVVSAVEAAHDGATTEWLSGDFGYAPYAGLVEVESDGAHRFVLCGVSTKGGYQILATCEPELGKSDERKLRKLFEKSIRYEGEVRNYRWTDEEALARWVEHTPKELHEKLEIRRTDHYIILYNAGGLLFAKKMEECHKAIRKVFPFPDIKGKRLLPVFLFRTREQYIEYYMSVAGRTRAAAARSKGHAWKDYYATYYEAPGDPVHIHEATHQIFANRLHLGGGGSWFQEGVAEYMESNKNEIKSVVRNLIKNEEHIPFKRFFVVPSLLQSIDGNSRRGGSNATNAYKQAASIIAFLRESKFGKSRFLDFVHAVGRVPRGDLKGIERELQRIYQVDIDGLESRWKKYWAK